eukprot:Nitzschia sp. Nitz4//scaffold313_size41840//9612//10730//NITZ4_007431-RA/size41840-processed-gene-0.2-mRNA-1//1//CDS//3329547415//9437//frame0
MYTTAVGFLVVLVAGVYWMYKKFREPLYNPGDVAKALAKDPDGFDSKDLITHPDATNGSFWVMPNNVKLFYFAPSQASSRPVLALHGGPSIPPEKTWEKMDMAVPGFYVYHARGCGHSTRIFKDFPTKGMWPGMKILEENLGIGAQVADVERIRRRLVESTGQTKIDLVGHSFGGLVATMYAAEFPQYVRSLTLLVPAIALTIPPKEPGSKELFGLVESKLEELGNDEHLQEYEAFVKRYMDFNSLPQQTDESLAKRQNEFGVHFFRATGVEGDTSNVEAGLTGGMACYATFLSMGIEHDYVPICQKMLENATFPVSIVHGADDLMPEGATRQYEQLFPAANVSFETIPNTGHFMCEHPRAVEIVKETMAKA